MSDHPHPGTPEAIITLPRTVVQDMVASLGKRCALLVEAQVRCKSEPRLKLLRTAHYELAEFEAELGWHIAQGKPYRYVVPLTAEEAQAIDEELKGGRK